MKIQVLGSGCPSCKKLHEVVLEAAKELDLAESVEYLSGVEGINKIVELGALHSPVLVVDDKIVMTGFSGDVEKIKSLIK
jgi:small redox-active disulfide protein 2